MTGTQSPTNTKSIKRVLLALTGLVVVIAVVMFVWRRGHRHGITERRVPVTRGDVTSNILSTGTVAPENRVEIKPPVAGRVENVTAREGQYVHKGDTLAWMSSTERAAMIDAAQGKGPSEVARWEEFYKPTPILAPINGTIILKNVEMGQTFTNSDSVFSMSDRLTVKAQVDETDLAQIHLKQRAIIILDAYSDDKIEGHVDRIAYDAKVVSNVTTYVVDVLPEKTPKAMRSGMTANVQFLLEAKTNVLLLPSEAVHTTGEHSFVMLAKSAQGEGHGKPIETAVTIGITDGKSVELLSGVEEGDRVVMPQLQIKGDRPNQSSPFSSSPGPGAIGGGGRGGPRH